MLTRWAGVRPGRSGLQTTSTSALAQGTQAVVESRPVVAPAGGVEANLVHAGRPQGVALQVERLGVVGLRDASAADQHVSWALSHHSLLTLAPPFSDDDSYTAAAVSTEKRFERPQNLSTLSRQRVEPRVPRVPDESGFRLYKQSKQIRQPVRYILRIRRQDTVQ